MAEARIDKWLWSVRLFKTRSLATEACKRGYVQIQGMNVKPSRAIKAGDVITVRRNPIVCTYKVLSAIQNRVGAKLVPDHMADITTPEQLELLELARLAAQNGRERGSGRPTKKERRDIDDFFEVEFDFDEEE